MISVTFPLNVLDGEVFEALGGDSRRENLGSNPGETKDRQIATQYVHSPCLLYQLSRGPQSVHQ